MATNASNVTNSTQNQSQADDAKDAVLLRFYIIIGALGTILVCWIIQIIRIRIRRRNAVQNQPPDPPPPAPQANGPMQIFPLIHEPE